MTYIDLNIDKRDMQVNLWVNMCIYELNYCYNESNYYLYKFCSVFEYCLCIWSPYAKVTEGLLSNVIRFGV